MHRLDFDFLGIRQQRADDDAGLVAQRLHPEQRVRRLMGQFNQAAQFVRRENHKKGLAQSRDEGTRKKRQKK